ncbi:MarR family winged helix-turn-helix transcriptional regulator [Williamsia maris]|uniref:DNA-binding transcriptional regulator, MarR family n=1 Tax=Williamsia maris TaxID=72806 RepID=A0ABT1HIX8_9NOCA|nr:MarR family transcriptional regulator [Williamsia maris]MCP2177882.1 DNA-binding transcriptional regulator, MarR family [Williamsia maris]
MTDDADDAAEKQRVVKSIEKLTAAMEEAALPALVTPLLDTELTIQQLKVLIVLVTTPDGSTGKGLAESFGVAMASMSGLLDRLVTQGVAERTEDPIDHRVRRVKATPLGASVVRKLVAARPEFRSDILMSVDLDDLRSLEKGMQAVSAKHSPL